MTVNDPPSQVRMRREGLGMARGPAARPLRDIGGDEAPVLIAEPFARWVVLDVANGAKDVGGGVEEDGPLPARPWEGIATIGVMNVLEWMQILVDQERAGGAFEQTGNLLNRNVMTSGDQMRMSRKDCTRGHAQSKA